MAGETGPKALEPQFIVSQAQSPCDGFLCARRKYEAPAMASETESGTRLRVPESGRKYEAPAMAGETP